MQASSGLARCSKSARTNFSTLHRLAAPTAFTPSRSPSASRSPTGSQKIAAIRNASVMPRGRWRWGKFPARSVMPHISVERIILPDSTILIDYMLARMTDILTGLRVFPERMRRNLNATQGLVFSGQLLLDLVEAGAPRDAAYQWVQENAMSAWESDSSFRERVARDARITKFLDPARLARSFDLE